MMRLKDVVDVNVLSLSNDTSPNFEFKYIDISIVNQFGITQEPKYIVFNEAPSRARRLIKKNDVIVSTVRTYLKAIAFIYFEPKDYVVSTGFAVLQPKKNIFPKYLGYYCQSEYFIDKVVSNSKGVSYPAINAGEIVQLPIINLPHSEQQAIANYLDAKTQAIDKKVSLLEQKIETYKKLKRTLINQTITKGLRSLSEVEMKDSGISWIGQMPQHWEVKRLKDFFKFSKGKNSSFYNQVYVNDSKNCGKYPVYSGQTENNGKMASINTFEYDYKNDVYLVTTVGAKAMEIKVVRGKFTLSQNCALIEYKKGKNSSKFNFYYLTQLFKEERKIIPTIMQPSLRIEDLDKYFLIVPPKSEQEEISKYLDQKTAIIDAIIGNVGRQMETLKQLRKTLINDVVTGKIMVVENKQYAI